MPLQGQWADTLLDAERLHVLKLLVWGALTVGAGTALIALIRVRRIDSPLLRHFAIQSAAWGAIDIVIAIWARQGLQLRDLASAVALDRSVWFNVGLDAGYVAVGATLALMGWNLGRRLGLVGAGLGVIMHGCALALLDLQLAAAIVR
jgi:hypothetical protein